MIKKVILLFGLAIMLNLIGYAQKAGIVKVAKNKDAMMSVSADSPEAAIKSGFECRSKNARL